MSPGSRAFAGWWDCSSNTTRQPKAEISADWANILFERFSVIRVMHAIRGTRRKTPNRHINLVRAVTDPSGGERTFRCRDKWEYRKVTHRWDTMDHSEWPLAQG